MDINVFLNLDYDLYSLEVMVDDYIDKLISFSVYPQLKEAMSELFVYLKPKLLEELEDLFKGKGLNTKTKKSELYETLENKLRNISNLLHLPIKESLFTRVFIEGEPSSIEFQSAELISMNVMVIEVALKNKLMARYEKLLPKKRTSAFKENYPLLDSCYKVYEGYKANKEVRILN